MESLPLRKPSKIIPAVGSKAQDTLLDANRKDGSKHQA